MPHNERYTEGHAGSPPGTITQGINDVTYLELLQAINTAPRQAGGCTPLVVEVARACQAADDGDGLLMINALLGWEVRNERKAGAGDEAAILENLRMIKERMTAAAPTAG